MGKTLTFDKPKDWKQIKPEHYQQFSIVSNEYTPCEYGFAIPNQKKSFDVVSIFNYGENGAPFIKELKDQLDVLANNNNAVDQINDYIKENADGYVVTKTDYIRPIYYKKGKLHDKSCFINIMKIKTNVTTSYSIQIFTEVSGNLYCITSSALNCDENKPFESLVKNYPHIEQAVNIVFKSMA